VLLGDFGRLQYLFWKESVPATSIYVFDVVQIEKVELGLAMNEFVSYNQKIACTLDLTPDCCARLINEAWPDPATRPSWSNDMLPAAIRIPAIFATMLLGGKGQELLLPDHGEEGRTRSMFKVHWSALRYDQALLPRPRSLYQAKAAIDHATIQEVIDYLCLQAQTITRSDDESEDEFLHLYQLATRMQAFCDSMNPWAVQSHCLEISKVRERVTIDEVTGESFASCSSPFKVVFLVRCLLLADLLRDCSNLKPVIVDAVKTILPKAASEPIVALIQNARVPDKSLLSRMRFLLDVAYMQLRYRKTKEHLQEGGAIRFLMADASEQGGIEYELQIQLRILVKHLADVMCFANELAWLWRGGTIMDDDDDLIAKMVDPGRLSREKDIYAFFKQVLDYHRPPPVTLGAGATTIADKFKVLMHANYLEAPELKTLQAVCREFVGYTTDMGVEYLLKRIRNPSIKTLFPWLPRRAAEQSQFCEEGEDSQLCSDDTVGLENTVPFCGLLHVIHNAGNDLEKSMKTLQGTVDTLDEITKMLRRKRTVERLCETCYNSPLGRPMQSKLKSVKVKVHRKRWGTVAHANVSCSGVELELRWGWSKNKYMRKSTHMGESEVVYADDNALRMEGELDGWDHAVKVESIDKGIMDPFFWGSLMMMENIYRILRVLMRWVESCPCHGDLLIDDALLEELDSATRQLWEDCPLRGHRIPEVVAGDFMKLVLELCEVANATICLRMPRDMTSEQKALLMLEFQRGRAHIIFVFAMKLTHVKEQPWNVFACAHFRSVTSKQAVRKALRSNSTHVLIVELKSDAVRAEVILYIEEDMPLNRLRCLAQFFGKLRMAFAAERSVEGSHAYFHRLIRNAPSHSTPYLSLGWRAPEIRDMVQNEPGVLFELADNVSKLITFRKCLNSVGMENHPSNRFSKHSWDPIYWKIVYHADQYSLYSKYGWGALAFRKRVLPSRPRLGGTASSAPDALEDLPEGVPDGNAMDVNNNSDDDGVHKAVEALVPYTGDSLTAPNTFIYAVKKKYALQCLAARLKELSKKAAHHIYLAPVPPGCIQNVLDIIAPSNKDDMAQHDEHGSGDVGPGRWSHLVDDALLRITSDARDSPPLALFDEHMSADPDSLVPANLKQIYDTLDEGGGIYGGQGALDRMMFFSKLPIAPSLVPRAESGFAFEAGDLAICVHALIGVSSSGEFAVDVNPLNNGRDSLVLDACALDLDDIKNIRYWEVKDRLSYGVNHLAEHQPPQHLQDMVPEVSRNLCSVGPAHGFVMELGTSRDPERARSLLDFYMQCGYVSRLEGDCGLVEWRLTNLGKSRVRIGQRCDLSEGQRALAPPTDRPYGDMVTYELVECLDSQGWTCVVISTKEGAKAVWERQFPASTYKHHDPLVQKIAH